MKVYMDNAATTRVDERVVESMIPYYKEIFANPSSLHEMAHQAKKAVEQSREKIAEFLNSEKEEIIFTSGGTESDNLALKGFCFANKDKGRHIITTKIEHDAILNSCKWLEENGFDVTYLSVDEYGLINLDDLEKSIRDDTILISIMTANNEIGTIQPIKEIGELAKKYNIVFHTDAVQGVGKVDIDVKRDNIDMLSLSSHKINGPKGVGVLYKKNEIKIDSWNTGGGHEFGLRSGTENVPCIVGLAKAMEILEKEMNENIERMTKIRDYLIENISKIENSRLNGHKEKRLCNNVNFSFDFIEGESLVTLLSDNGIMASTGSACSSKSLDPSHVLLAIGLEHEQAHGSLRLSLDKYSTIKEAEYVLNVLPDIVERLRKISPMGD